MRLKTCVKCGREWPDSVPYYRTMKRSYGEFLSKTCAVCTEEKRVATMRRRAARLDAGAAFLRKSWNHETKEIGVHDA